MKAMNSGLIYTNDKCVGCIHCLTVCKVLGANVFSDYGGINRVLVDGSKCIHCGQCIESCTHGAREYRDDTDIFLSDLRSGEKISLLVAPSFFTSYYDQVDTVLGQLRSLGANNIYSVSIGTDINAWAHVNYLEQHPEKNMISTMCPVVTNFLGKRSPDLYDTLVPIHSPMVCTAVHARKYCGDSSRLAYIGPCIAAKDEIEASHAGGLIRYNVTFDRLLNRLSSMQFPKHLPAPDVQTVAGTDSPYPVPESLRENLERFIRLDREVISMPSHSASWSIGNYEQLFRTSDSGTPFILEVIGCGNGCTSGPAAGPRRHELIATMHAYRDQLRKGGYYGANSPYNPDYPQAKRLRLLNLRYKNYELGDFIRKLDEIYEQTYDIPEYVLEEIYNNLHMRTEEERNINCGCCGYSTCREMVKAVAYGYNLPEKCAHYSHEENRRLYLTDTRSRVANFNAYIAALQKHIKSGRLSDYAAMLIHIDQWELIAERYGYDRACEIFYAFARSVERLMQNNELLAIRSETSYMAIVRRERMEAFADQMWEVSRHPVCEEGDECVPLEVRIGVYSFIKENEQVGEILTNMHVLSGMLDESKEGIVCYDGSFKEEIMKSLHLTQHVPDALSKGQFIAYFQPKVNIRTLRLDGAEALVRWRTQDGILPPNTFIPICEKSGLVNSIDLYMLNHVCSCLRTWLDQGVEPVRISCNFSKTHFRSLKVVDDIISLVDKWNIPHDLIEIEFTETAYIEGSDILRESLSRLHQSGFFVAMDDFGTGYSSLSLLQELPCDILKLDQSLISMSVDNERSKAVLRNMIAMAKEIELRTVAEGVERREEFELLQELGCDVIQGYYFDRPLSNHTFETRLRQPQYRLSDDPSVPTA